MTHFFRNTLLSFFAVTGVMLSSCDNEHDNDTTSQYAFVDHLPEATNIGSTSAFIPVQDKGFFEIHYGVNNDLTNSHALMSFNTITDTNARGFGLRGLEPDTTYYYTMVCLSSKDPIYSNQTKSFKTKGVSIKFIDSETVSMGKRDRQILRLQTSGIEDEDVPYYLFVQVRSWSLDNPTQVGLSAVTTFAGNGIWKDDDTPSEGDCYQAVVKTHSGRIVAKTPIVVWENGALKELSD